MPGRLHTCYSPVRRSPAADGKPSAPLPLDLHVLSLSLAFILSQDQTLRCYLYLFLFFRDHAGAPRGGARRRGGRPARRDASLTCLFGTDRGLHLRRRRPGRDGRRAPVLFFLIHCKTFNVLSSGCPGRLAPKNFAKLATFSETTKFSGDFFQKVFQGHRNILAEPTRQNRVSFSGTSVPKASAKLGTSDGSAKLFSDFFSSDYRTAHGKCHHYAVLHPITGIKKISHRRLKIHPTSELAAQTAPNIKNRTPPQKSFLCRGTKKRPEKDAKKNKT